MKIKIFFVVQNLSAGGAEKVMSFLSQNINQVKYNTKLIVIGFENDTVYDTSGVETLYLNHNHVREAFLSLIKVFRREKPQIVMGAITHVNLTLGLISFLFPKIIFVGRQTGIGKIELVHKKKPNILFEFLVRIGLKKLDYIICQSVDMLEDCKEKFQFKKEKFKIIHNPITDNFKVKNRDKTFNSTTDTCKFITVGRLVPIKGHERILEVLSNFKLPFIYIIIGNGPKKIAIQEKVDSLGLQESVMFINFTKEIPKYLAQSDFYLQGSYAEGFPNALLESCAVGTPVIAFNAPGGTNEIVEEGINGYLVKDEKDFLDHLNNLEAFDPRNVSKSVFKKYAKEIILKEYESFFQYIVNK